MEGDLSHCAAAAADADWLSAEGSLLKADRGTQKHQVIRDWQLATKFT